MGEKRLTIEWREGATVSAAFTQAGETGLVLAPGAGGNLDSPFLVELAAGLAGEKVSTLRFNFSYTERRKGAPDPAPVLEECYRAVARRASELIPKLFIGGKSMGGRIASQIAAQQKDLPPILGLVFLGYPLHAPGKQDKPRDKHLPDIRMPMLFVEGTRDAFADRPLLEAVLGRLGKRAEVHWIEGGDHSFKVSKRKPADVQREILDTVVAFLRS
jgi:predicted alpha/beta-hydrolase family hydrolase